MSEKVGVRNRTDLKKFEETIKKEAVANHEDPEHVWRIFDTGLRDIFGKFQPNEHLQGSRWLKLFKNFQFSRLMNQAGFSMLAELGPMMAYSSFKNLTRSMPEARRLFKQLQDGTFSSEEARRLSQLVPTTAERYKNLPFYRKRGLHPSKMDRLYDGLDNATKAAMKITSLGSGLQVMQEVMQFIAARATLLDLLDHANGKAMSKAVVRRYRQYGMSEKVQAELFAHLKGKKNIMDVDPSAMSFDSSEAISNFMYRATNHKVLGHDVSDTMLSQHTAIGQLFFQFRNFMMSSYTRHFLNSLHNLDDFRTWAMMTSSTLFAALGWSARTYLNTIGDPERRKKMLTLSNIAKYGFQQNSFSSIIPGMTDFMWSNVMRNDKVFAYGRSSGLAADLSGIPIIDFASKLESIPGLFVSGARGDRQITQHAARDAVNLMWFQNFTGVRNIWHMLLKDLPKSDPNDPNNPY